MAELIPRWQRRAAWTRLREAGIALPDLRFGLMVGLPLFCLAVSPAVLGWMWANSAAWLLAAIVLALLAFRFARPLRAAVPSSCQYVGDAARFLSWQPAVVGSLSREQVGERVRKLIAENLGVRESEVTDDAEFVKDLNCG